MTAPVAAAPPDSSAATPDSGSAATLGSDTDTDTDTDSGPGPGSGLGSADPGQPGDASTSRGSRAAILATLASRVTGLVRLGVSAAVLGPTFLGNIFQSVNLVPNLVYGLVGGALLAGLVVPALVGPLAQGDKRRAREIGGRVHGSLLLAGAALTALSMLSAPLLARLLTGDTPVDVAQDSRRVAQLLLLIVAPQLLAYIVSGVAAAAQHAVGRYGLSLGGFAIENVGVIVGLLAVAAAYGTGREVDSTLPAQVVLFGLVGSIPPFVHAALQLWWAQRCGVAVWPRLTGARRDDVVRSIGRQAVPSLLSATLICGRYFVVAVVVASVAGGWVALQIALTFLVLPSGLIARPLATTLLGPVARRWMLGDVAACRRTYRRALAQVNFLAVPAALGLSALAWPIAALVARGAMAEGQGVRLVAWCLVAVGAGVLGDSLFEVSKAAALSCRAASTVLSGMAVRVGTTLVLLVPLWLVDDAGGGWGADSVLLPALAGATVAGGDLVGAWHLHRRLERMLRRASVGPVPSGLSQTEQEADQAADGVADGVAGGVAHGLAAQRTDQRAWPSLGWRRIIPASLVMILAPLMAATVGRNRFVAEGSAGLWSQGALLVGSVAVALVVYLAAHLVVRSPELALWRNASSGGTAGGRHDGRRRR